MPADREPCTLARTRPGEQAARRALIQFEIGCGALIAR
jgi:hypothetical protein